MTGFSNIGKALLKEKHLFLLLVILNCLPLLSGRYYPSLDGPAHLYNSNLLIELLRGNSFLSDYFTINQELVPNWIGHFILGLLKLLFPSEASEKIFLLFYAIGLPYAFRILIKSINNNQALLYSYFIFPFTYSLLFVLGFYNFSISLVVMFFTLSYWYRNKEIFPKIKQTVTFLILLITVYFSHVFIYTVLLMIIGFDLIFEILKHKSKLPNSKPLKFKTILFLFISLLPTLLLFAKYFSNRIPNSNTYLNKVTLIKWIYEFKPLIAYNYENEVVYTQLIFYSLFIVLLISLFFFFKSLIKKVDIVYVSKIIFWLIVCLVLMVLYFIMPDSDGYAGYISVRILLVFFIFFIVLLSMFKVPTYLGWLLVFVVLGSNYKLNNYYKTVSKNLNETARDVLLAGENIPSNSVVLPIDFSGHWLKGHFSNYLGVDKPLIVLENYEASTGYFPILWNEQNIPNLIIKNNRKIKCLHWKKNKQNKEKNIDYIFVLGNVFSNECVQEILNDFTLIYSNKSCSVYKLDP